MMGEAARTCCLLAALGVTVPVVAGEATAVAPGEGSGRVIDYDGEAPRERAVLPPPRPAAAPGTRRVELITGGNSTDGAARVGVLPVQD